MRAITVRQRLEGCDAVDRSRNLEASRRYCRTCMKVWDLRSKEKKRTQTNIWTNPRPIPLKDQFTYRGALGLWTPPTDIADRIRKLVTE